MWSRDGGRIWSEPAVPFWGLSGRTNSPTMAVDSAGTLHLITAAAGEDGFESRVYWSYWTGDGWTEPVAISGDLRAPESPDLVITEGNVLNVAWHVFGITNQDRVYVWFTAM